MNFRLRDYALFAIAIQRYHSFLNESQYWTTKKRQDWVQEKLDKILRYAVKNVPYYKKTLTPYVSRFNEMIDRLDLSELPLVTKEIIREHYQELIADNSEKFRPRPDRTSGSTGSPMKFLLDKQSDIANFAGYWRMLNWVGYKFGNRFASIIPNYEKETQKEIFFDIRQNCLQLPLVNLKKESIQIYIKKLRQFNPVFIKSYASTLALFAYWIQEANIENYRPKAVLACAETLLDHQKKSITEILKCPVYDFYGQNERACLISTCDKGRYHIHEEYSFVELVDENSQLCTGTTPGQIIATTFDNFAMPLIRYQTNDMAVANNHNQLCECGRTYKTVHSIIGRVDDMIYTPQGLQVARLDNTLKDSPGILEAQFVQKQIDNIQVNVVRSPSFQQEDVNNLLRRLHFRLGSLMNIEINFVNFIPLGKNGKRKFIISELDKESLLVNRNFAKAPSYEIA